MKSFYLLFILLFSVVVVQAQLSWQEHYNDANLKALSIHQLPDSQMLNILGIKQDELVSLIFNKTNDLSTDISFTPSSSFNPISIFYKKNTDYLLLHQDSDSATITTINAVGQVKQSLVFSTPAQLKTIVGTLDNGVLLGGNINNNMYLLVLDSLGGLVWEQSFGGIGKDEVLCAIALPDSGYLVGGYADFFASGETDMLLIRIDKNGKNLWERAYGEPETRERLSNIGCSVDDELILVGTTENQIWVLQLNKKQQIVNQQYIALKDHKIVPTAIWIHTDRSVLISTIATNTTTKKSHLYLLRYQF